MHILQINTIDTKGGAAKVAYNLHTELRKRGHHMSMFVKLKYSDDPDVHEMKWLNPITRFMKTVTGKDLGSILANKIRPLLANDIEFFKSDKILETKEFKQADIIHCHNLHGNYFNISTLEKMARVKPVIWTLHDMWAVTPYCAHTLDFTPENGFYRCVNPPAYQSLPWNNEKYLGNKKKRIYSTSMFHVVTPCKWLEEITKKTVLANHPTSVIYNGINTEVFKPYDKLESRKILKLPRDGKIILFLSAIGQSHAKGWDQTKMVARHFENDKNIAFLSVGSINKDNSLTNVIYRGHVDDTRLLAQYYSAADVLLFPSPAETFPLVPLEAMACGLPVVSFNVGGVKEAVLHQVTGYISREKSSDLLLEGINTILHLSDGAYRNMSQKALDGVRQYFSLDGMIEKYLTLYRKVA